MLSSSSAELASAAAIADGALRPMPLFPWSCQADGVITSGAYAWYAQEYGKPLHRVAVVAASFLSAAFAIADIVADRHPNHGSGLLLLLLIPPWLLRFRVCL